MVDEEKNNDYDLEPVVYCSRCYSLKIKHDDTFDEDYCVECGCTDVCESSIEDWEALYERRYGNKFAEKHPIPKQSFLSKMNVQELKDFVCNRSDWKSIIKALYPGFPEGLSKADCIILLFNKIASDNRMEELKIVLANKINK